jgi:4-amino-4-deoxy-L-arabinose transferase-like glycosyltransferase
VAIVARLAYSAWLSPWQLVGDEAYYWVQAHHLDWGYTEKGPLLAWMIAGATKLFGDTEFAVRLPLILCYALAAWGVGRLAMSASRGDQRVGFFAVALFLLLPAFTANAHITTQDGPLIALWIALTAVSLRLFRRWEAGRGTWGEWMLLWALLGLGFILKQSIFTFLPGLAIYWLVFRRALPIRPVLFAQQAAGVLVLLSISSPMLLWNNANGWPMLAHTLGHLGAGGDQEGKVQTGNALMWEAKTIGSFIGAFGPAVVLMVWASVRAWRTRASDAELWRAQFLMICCAWTTTLFFVLLSLRKPVVPSWPLPNMGPMVVVVAQLLVTELVAVRTAPTRASTVARGLWRTSLIYGLVATFILAFPMIFAHVPRYGDLIQSKVLSRLTGHRETFARLDAVMRATPPAEGRPPLVVAPNYQVASLATFYLPGHPPVATRGNYTGFRPSNFDHWPETDLANDAQRGRTLVFVKNVKGDDPNWSDFFNFDELRPTSDPQFLLALNYRGPRPRAWAEAHP